MELKKLKKIINERVVGDNEMSKQLSPTYTEVVKDDYKKAYKEAKASPGANINGIYDNGNDRFYLWGNMNQRHADVISSLGLNGDITAFAVDLNFIGFEAPQADNILLTGTVTGKAREKEIATALSKKVFGMSPEQKAPPATQQLAQEAPAPEQTQQAPQTVKTAPASAKKWEI